MMISHNVRRIIVMLPFLVCGIEIKSSLDLEGVGVILSKKLFGGIPFGGLEERIRDEIPAIFLTEDIMGFDIILQGNQSSGEYFLEITPTEFPSLGSSSQVDFSKYIAFLLKDCDELLAK